ncbi:hypothetical protein [Bacillus toyonensis]|uniref:hypothetical protein n=1 Tax=Bacillus toyonensis TaxID=155322 RepID=UPI00211D4688|nr:hypothetical protein [Bacillus toyonensis]
MLKVADLKDWKCDLETDEKEQEALQTLTEMETKVWNYLVTEGWYAEATFSDVIAKDVEVATEIPMKQLRGVISSLEQKGLIQLILMDDTNLNFIYRELDFRCD